MSVTNLSRIQRIAIKKGMGWDKIRVNGEGISSLTHNHPNCHEGSNVWLWQAHDLIDLIGGNQHLQGKNIESPKQGIAWGKL